LELHILIATFFEALGHGDIAEDVSQSPKDQLKENDKNSITYPETFEFILYYF